MVLLSGSGLLFSALPVSRLSSPCLYGGFACASARTSALGSHTGHGEEKRRVTISPKTLSRLLVHLSPGGNHTAIGMSENRDAVRATFYPHRAGPWCLPADVGSNYQPWPPCPHSRMAPIPPCAPSH